MPLCSVWIVNKFVNNSFEKKESKKIFTRIIWGLFILIQIVMETEKGNVSIQKGIISFFVILGIIIIGYKGTFQRKLLFTSLFISIWILSEFFVYFILNEYYGTAEPPVRCGESHLSGLTEPLHFVY